MAQAVISIPNEVRTEADRFALAERILDSVSDAGRKSADWQTARVRVLLHQGEADEAVTLAEKVVEANPKYFEARFLLGWGYYQKKHFARARTILERLSSEQSENVQVLYILGLTLTELDEYILAKAVLGRARDLDESNSAILSAFIRVLQQVSGDEAIVAMDDIDELYRKNPSDAQSIEYKLKAEIALGNEDKVRQVLNAASRIAVKTPSHVESLAWGYLYLKEPETAARFAEQMRLQAPDNPQSHLLYAWTLVAQRNVNDAIAELTKARERFKNPVEINVMLADLHMQQGQIDKVIELAEHVLSGSPSNTRARLLLAHAYAGLSMGDVALEHVQMVLDNDQNNAAALELMSRVYNMMGQTERALEAIDSPAFGLDMDPSHIYRSGENPVEAIEKALMPPTSP